MVGIGRPYVDRWFMKTIKIKSALRRFFIHHYAGLRKSLRKILPTFDFGNSSINST